MAFVGRRRLILSCVAAFLTPFPMPIGVMLAALLCTVLGSGRPIDVPLRDRVLMTGVLVLAYAALSATYYLALTGLLRLCGYRVAWWGREAQRESE
jgi:hypothetical protein